VPDQTGYGLTHGFHPYPGRFHPNLPRTLLPKTGGKETLVCDPFMGGGTTLVEAALCGMPAIGNDLNPIAVMVTRERTRPRTPKQAMAVTKMAENVAAQVEALRREKNAPRARIPRLDRLAPHYQPHLLAEFVQWQRLLQDLPDSAERDTLLAVFSSAVVKYSNRRSDSRGDTEPPRYPKGAVSKFLVEKAKELTEAQVHFGNKLRDQLRIRLLQEDGTMLPSLEWGSVDMVLTSPPYPGTYDYFDHHQMRMDWLGIEDAAFEDGEIGAKREADGERWSSAMDNLMLTMARILRPGGNAFIVIGDWEREGHAVDARHAMERFAGQQNWELISWASAQRAIHSRTEKRIFAKKGKWEHLLHFVRGEPKG